MNSYTLSQLKQEVAHISLDTPQQGAGEEKKDRCNWFQHYT